VRSHRNWTGCGCVSGAIGVVKNPHGIGEWIIPPLQRLGSCGAWDTQGGALGAMLLGPFGADSESASAVSESPVRASYLSPGAKPWGSVPKPTSSPEAAKCGWAGPRMRPCASVPFTGPAKGGMPLLRGRTHWMWPDCAGRGGRAGFLRTFFPGGPRWSSRMGGEGSMRRRRGA